MTFVASMRQLEERHVATKIELMVWSNKMDLLVFSNTKGEVSLHRLNWQRVWLLTPPVENAHVDGLMWRPDGKVIAIAYSTFRVLLINVENKETLHTIILPSRVSVISWPQEKDKDVTNNLLNKNIASVYLPKLPTLCRHFRTEAEPNEENLEDIKKIKSQTVLNFLILCLEDGKISISVFGLYNVTQIDTNIHLPRGHLCGKILACELSKDLHHLFVSVLVTSKTTQNIKLLTLDTKMLHDRSKELHTLSIKYGHILSLLDYLSNTMSNLKETWENILLKEMQLKLSNYASLQPPGQLSTDFLELLVFGTPSESLERFLMRDLCDKSIKKLGNVIELNCLNMQRLILKHLYSFGQNLAYHISELKGMSKLATFSSLGLKEEVVSVGFTSIGVFLVKATEVQYVIDDFLKKHKAFFKWLHHVILKMTESIPDSSNNEWSTQELQFIADYLCTFDELGSCESDQPPTPNTTQKIFMDTLGQYFVDKELVKPYKHATNPWEQLLESNPCLQKHNIIIPRHSNLSLIQEINNLKLNIEAIFKTTESAINTSIGLKTIHQIRAVKGDTPVMSMAHVIEEKKLVMTFVDKDKKSFDLVEVSEDSEEVTVLNCFFSNIHEQINTSASTENLNIQDVQFYNSTVLAVLLEDDAAHNSVAMFIFVPLSTIKSNIISGSSEQIASTPQCGPGLDLTSVFETKDFFVLDSLVGARFALSGVRNVLVVLAETRRKIRLFEIDTEGEEEGETGDEEMLGVDNSVNVTLE
uniref:Anaphase-promoting complex subunit 4 n=1 Tax=Cacopsylla melanoneura TaxID=428564 RepID=A0A8D8X9F5_9HEMI